MRRDQHGKLSWEHQKGHESLGAGPKKGVEIEVSHRMCDAPGGGPGCWLCDGELTDELGESCGVSVRPAPHHVKASELGRRGAQTTETDHGQSRARVVVFVP